jgi:hypothetical protein
MIEGSCPLRVGQGTSLRCPLSRLSTHRLTCEGEQNATCCCGKTMDKIE